MDITHRACREGCAGRKWTRASSVDERPVAGGSHRPQGLLLRAAQGGQRGGQSQRGPSTQRLPCGPEGKSTCLTALRGVLSMVPGKPKCSVSSNMTPSAQLQAPPPASLGGGQKTLLPLHSEGPGGSGRGVVEPPAPPQRRAWAWAGRPWMPAVAVEGTRCHQDPLPSGPSPVAAENGHRAQKSPTQSRSQAPFFIKTHSLIFHSKITFKNRQRNALGSE